MAVLTAMHVEKFLSVPVSLITDRWTKEYGEKKYDYDFDNIIVVDRPEQNYRPFHNNTIEFLNKNRYRAFELSPYDETIMIDADYIVQSDLLNHIWGHGGYLVPNSAIDLHGLPMNDSETRLCDEGIGMKWATVMYWDKSEESENFFKIQQHVVENYEFFSLMYGVSPKIFRNDYAMSIADHIYHGRSGDGFYFPFSLRTAYQIDDILDVDDDKILMISHAKNGQNSAVVWVDGDVHVMNKYALNEKNNLLKSRL